jgi:hypothetical protein
MIPTYVEPHPSKGELRIGWASWDDGFKDRSVKWAYRDGSGKISRGCPEVPIDVLVQMLLLVFKQGELSAEQIGCLKGAFTD